MSNKTAVQQIIERAKLYPSKEIREYILNHIIKEEESLMMEKEQIIKARNSYIKQMYNKSIDSLINGEVNHKIITSEQYYNETYGNKIIQTK
jgi:hypothetical protein